eukprot:6186216-Pleurochrysis_carterae.AAC.1
MWPQCKSVRGQARHSESNGGVERLNQTVQRRRGDWIRDTGSRNWSIGCLLVQWAFNTTVHSSVKSTPYELVYGQKPNVGISQLPLSEKLIDTLQTEQELIMDALKDVAASATGPVDIETGADVEDGNGGDGGDAGDHGDGDTGHVGDGDNG